MFEAFSIIRLCSVLDSYYLCVGVGSCNKLSREPGHSWHRCSYQIRLLCLVNLSEAFLGVSLNPWERELYLPHGSGVYIHFNELWQSWIICIDKV